MVREAPDDAPMLEVKKNEWTELLKRTKNFGFDIYIYIYMVVCDFCIFIYLYVLPVFWLYEYGCMYVCTYIYFIIRVRLLI